MTTEPLITIAVITAAVGALVGLLVSFGVDITEDQEVAMLRVATVVAPLIVGLLARRKVRPVAAA